MTSDVEKVVDHKLIVLNKTYCCLDENFIGRKDKVDDHTEIIRKHVTKPNDKNIRTHPVKISSCRI